MLLEEAEFPPIMIYITKRDEFIVCERKIDLMILVAVTAHHILTVASYKDTLCICLLACCYSEYLHRPLSKIVFNP